MVLLGGAVSVDFVASLALLRVVIPTTESSKDPDGDAEVKHSIPHQIRNGDIDAAVPAQFHASNNGAVSELAL
jgi:hypothetical protein